MSAISNVGSSTAALNQMVQSAAAKKPAQSPAQAPVQSKGGSDPDHDGDSDGGGLDIKG